jgi:hypothetical protein
MRTTLADRIKGFFARDKYAFWFNHFTDEEKQLRRMDVWQLAKIINEAHVRNLAGEAEKLIVAEHMLAERLARIQARPTYIAIYAGLAGVVGGAFLTSALQSPNQPIKCICEALHVAQDQRSNNPPVPPIPAVSKTGSTAVNANNANQPKGSGNSKP